MDAANWHLSWDLAQAITFKWFQLVTFLCFLTFSKPSKLPNAGWIKILAFFGHDIKMQKKHLESALFLFS